MRRTLRNPVLCLSLTLVLAAPMGVMAQDNPSSPLASAGVLEFGPNNVLFVGDTKGGAVHAFELRGADLTSQAKVSLGSARTFEGRDLIERTDQQVAAYLGTSVVSQRITNQTKNGENHEPKL